MASGWITIGTRLDTKEFDAQIQQVERDLDQMEQSYSTGKKMGFKEDEEDLRQLEVQIEKTKNKLVSLKKQKEKSTQTNNINGMSNAFKSVGSSVQNAISKVAKLALGVFAVRSAYMALRRASSELASYDQQYASNIEYIRYALTQMIAPVLRWIVQMAGTLLSYINLILNRLFGINLFANGSAESFNKMKSSAGGVSKAVKEIKKQLTGFDEINMLTDQSDTGTGAGGGGVGMPDFDLSKIQGDIPAWLQWIFDHGDTVIAILSGLAGLIAGFKIAGFLKMMGVIQKVPLKTIAGIAIAIGGIVYAIEKVIDYLKDPSWENFGGIIVGIGITIAGIAIAIGAWPVALAGALVAIVGLIIKYWQQIKGFLQGGIDWLISKTDWVREQFGIVGEFIYNIFINYLQGLLNWFDLLFTTMKNIFDGVITFLKGVFTGNWKQAWEGIKKIFVAQWDYIKGLFSIFATFINNSVIKPVVKLFTTLWDTLKKGAQLAWDGIVSVFSKVVEFFKNTFTNAWTAVKNVFSVGGKIFDGIKEGIVNAFKTIVNGIIGGINKVISVPFNTINSTLNSIKGVEIAGLKPFDSFWGWNPIYVPQIPTLKTGGIINMPNRGTMVGGMAIGGEAGREGVVPLTDQQAMAELGREIGRNVLVNLTNITSMNGRVISRELKNIQSEADFAYNQ